MRLLPLLLLASCGGSSFVTEPDAPVYVHVVADMTPYAAPPAIGRCDPAGESWQIHVQAGMHSGLTWTTTAHELLHVLGLSFSHGEPYPCLGGASTPGPYEMVLCDGDRTLLALAVGRGVAHDVFPSPEAERAVAEATSFLNVSAGGIIFTVHAESLITAITGAEAAPALGQVVFEIGVAAGNGRDPREGRRRDRRAPQVGVNDDAGGVDDGPERAARTGG